MADALRQARRVRAAAPVPTTGATAMPAEPVAEMAELAEIVRFEIAPVTPFPAVARPVLSKDAEDSDHTDRRWALLLLTVTLLLMLSVIATGWFLVGGDEGQEGSEAATTSRIERAPTP